MEANPTTAAFRQISVILRGEPEPINRWIQEWNAARVLHYVVVIVAGTGIYGAAMGYWRDPMQAAYTAVKFPLIILLTMLGNGLLNGMLAPLLGLNISFRQSFQAILMSSMIAGAILGSFSPIVFFLIWNAPQMTSHVSGVYDLIMLTHVTLIAFAGMAGNLRLAQLLHRLSGSNAISRRVLFAWLAGNLFLGSQLSWILRPFIGAPGMPIQFLRDHPFDGNFYETIFSALKYLFSW
ncbi:MAG: hypothetical protein JWR26_2316 [Pedosphaera sp.]|nr:hypothetical protein [Pedosphaera sp.]